MSERPVLIAGGGIAGLALGLTLHQIGDHEHPPLRTERVGRGNLPRRLGRLHGRDDAVADVVAALEMSTIVTLVGPGGIGKTRLALSAAEAAGLDRSAGAWLVELADVTDGTDVVRAVVDALDATVRDSADPLAAIIDRIADTDALLVLDNCEHVVDGVVDLVLAIVDRCPAGPGRGARMADLPRRQAVAPRGRRARRHGLWRSHR